MTGANVVNKSSRKRQPRQSARQQRQQRETRACLYVGLICAASFALAVATAVFAPGLNGDALGLLALLGLFGFVGAVTFIGAAFASSVRGA